MMAARSAPLNPGVARAKSKQVDIRPQLHLSAVYLQNFEPALHVRQRNVHLSIESAGPGERRVEHVDAVCACNDDDLIVGFEPVHLDEDGVQRLLTLVVPAAS